MRFLPTIAILLPILGWTATVFAEPQLPIGPIEGLTGEWHAVPPDVQLPLGVTAELRPAWGRNLADRNANGVPDECDITRGIVGTNNAFFLELSAATGEASPISGLGLRGFPSVLGLAYDPNTNTLYGADSFTDQLIVIDQATGVGTAVGPLGFGWVVGLAFDPNTNTLYGTNTATKQLIIIDPATGAGTAVGTLGSRRVEGLAFDPNTSTLYGSTGDILIVIDPATGASTPVGFLGFRRVWGLAFDSNTNTLYGTDFDTRQLIVIDPATGAGTPVGIRDFRNVWGLAFDPNTDTLYGTDRITKQLIVIDPATGARTPVGPLGSRDVQGLAFDPNTNTLYGTDRGWLIIIDASTGAGTPVGALGIGGASGLAFDPNTDTLYGANAATDQLIVIDPATGAGTLVGSLSPGSVYGLAFDPNTNTLYGTDTRTDQLLVIDPTTGAGAVVGALGFARVDGLAFDANTNTLYGSDISTDQLIVIDPATGAGTPVGAQSSRGVGDLAFDPNTNTLYGTDPDTQLRVIDQATGAGTAVGALGFSNVHGLAFDPNSSTLYGTHFRLDRSAQLIGIDPATGEGKLVGDLGFVRVLGLAFDSNTNTLYGTGIDPDQLIVIDSTTGEGSPVGGLGFGGVWGLAFDPNTNTLYGTDWLSGQLIVIDPFTGAGTAVGDLGFRFVDGLAFDPDTNTLYGTDTDTGQLIVIDPATGAGTPIGPTRYQLIVGLAFVPSLDCNGNDTQDICDIAAGASEDCNSNSVPDECEPDVDCNGNRVRDICDIAQGTSEDCNSNRIPDECEPLEDCNANGVQDSCDLTQGTSTDCNFNRVPDECEPLEDCNANSVQDYCDLALGTSRDCQGDQVPDECQSAGNDCNANGIPDECEPDFVTQDAKLLASDGAMGDSLGFSVAVSGDTVVVGASRHQATGDRSGSAYVFVRTGTSWSQQAKLLPSDGAELDLFGISVAISGETIVVGAWLDDDNGINSGSAYVFVRNGTVWSQQAKLLPSDGTGGDWFGFSVGISGNTLVVGASGDRDHGENSGSAYAFVRSGTSWSQQAKLLPSDGAAFDSFGFSLAISSDTVVVGASGHSENGFNSGSAYVFEKPPLGWSNMTETAKLLPTDGAQYESFGDSVAISGETIVVGASRDFDNGNSSGSAYVFEKPPLGWANMAEAAKLLPSDGTSLAVFGSSVAISGDRVVVGAPGIALCEPWLCLGPGSAYLYEKPLPGWVDMVESVKLLPCDDARANRFGTSVAISSNSAVVGAPGDHSNGRDSGSANVFKLPPLVLPLDIKPGVCPNSFNRSGHGVLPVALLGTEDVDASSIDPTSILLSRADGVGGAVAPHEGPPGPHTVTEDLATPFDGESCECHAITADGLTDLSMKFRTDDLVAALELYALAPGALVELIVTGTLLDGTEFIASDCVRLVPPGTGPGTLTVNSNLPHAWIEISPLDQTLDGGGFGHFDRTWPQSTVVTFSAEEFHQGQRFVGWKFNGQFLSRDTSTVVTVIDETKTVDAVFRRAGDITNDQAIDLYDFAIFAACFGQTWGDNLEAACSNEALASADLDRNGVIDLRDFSIFALHFGS